MEYPNTRTWLHDTEHRQICRLLQSYQLVKHDPATALPLKNGGTTDLRFELRNTRSDPQATRIVAGWFRKPLEHLQPDRFAEVPEALSGVAGHLSTILRMPYLTVRERAKEYGGHFSDPLLIGDSSPGDSVVIIDDVITDGASKLSAIRACKERGLRISAIVVLIDRAGGWRETFGTHGIDIPVWAGMTITEARNAFLELEQQPSDWAIG